MKILTAPSDVSLLTVLSITPPSWLWVPHLGRLTEKPGCSVLWCKLEIHTPQAPVHSREPWPSSQPAATIKLHNSLLSFLSEDISYSLERLILLSPETSITYIINLYIFFLCAHVPCSCVCECAGVWCDHQSQNRSQILWVVIVPSKFNITTHLTLGRAMECATTSCLGVAFL